MDNLGAVKLVVYVNHNLKGARPLTPEQEMLIRQLVVRTMERGFWAKTHLRNALLEEMVNTSRHIGGETHKQIEELMAGIDVSVTIMHEEEGA